MGQVVLHEHRAAVFGGDPVEGRLDPLDQHVKVGPDAVLVGVPVGIFLFGLQHAHRGQDVVIQVPTWRRDSALLQDQIAFEQGADVLQCRLRTTGTKHAVHADFRLLQQLHSPWVGIIQRPQFLQQPVAVLWASRQVVLQNRVEELHQEVQLRLAVVKKRLPRHAQGRRIRRFPEAEFNVLVLADHGPAPTPMHFQRQVGPHQKATDTAE